MKYIFLLFTLSPLYLSAQGAMSIATQESSSVEKRYQKALKQLSERKYDEALLTMETIITNVSHDSLLAPYAYLLELNGEYDKASAYYARYLATTESQFYSIRKSSCDKFNVEKNTAVTNIFPLESNTEYDEFCGFVANSSLIKISSTPVKKYVPKLYKNELFFRYYDEEGNVLTAFAPKKKYYHDGPAHLIENEKKLYFTHNQQSHKFSKKTTRAPLKIFIADFDSSGIHNVTSFEWNSKNYAVAHPAISPDGHFLVFASDNPEGNGRSDLYVCTKNGKSWNEPINLGNAINTAGNELFPYFKNDTTLIFSSNGHYGMGGLDLFEATFKSGRITTVKNMGTPLNSTRDDFAFILLNDSTGFLSSNRNKTTGDDIFTFSFTTPKRVSKTQKKEKATFTRKIINANTNEPLVNVIAVHATPVDSLVSLSNEAGEIQLLPAKEGTLTLSKPGFITQRFSVANNEKDLSIPAQLHPVKEGMLIEIENIYYEYNSHFITHLAQPPLDSLAKIMLLNPSLHIEISSHTDARGSKKYNEELSLNRAKEVVKYLESRGVSKQRLYIRFFGEELLVNDCGDRNDCNEYEHSVNRRTEFRILKH